MKFYRLEDKKTKTGIYRSDIKPIENLIWEYYRDGGNHPGPTSDSLMQKEMEKLGWEEVDQNYIFGFNTVEQYRAWFTQDGHLEVFLKNGTVLNCYETEDFLMGHAQMIARKETLVFVEEVNIITAKGVNIAAEPASSV